MAVLAGGSSGTTWAWDADDDNVADRLLTLASDAGLPETWVPDSGAVLSVRGGHELVELDVGINVVADGVTNGTNTLTSASAPFESSMVGLSILITGHGQRIVTAHTSATSIDFSGAAIAADTGIRVVLPVGIAVFTDGVTDGSNTLTSAAAPFNASHVGTSVSVETVGSREITAFTSATSVDLSGAAIAAAQGRKFTLLTDIEPGDLGLETAGGQVVDSHGHPALTTAAVMRWNVGERRRRGPDRLVDEFSGKPLVEWPATPEFLIDADQPSTNNRPQDRSYQDQGEFAVATGTPTYVAPSGDVPGYWHFTHADGESYDLTLSGVDITPPFTVVMLFQHEDGNFDTIMDGMYFGGGVPYCRTVGGDPLSVRVNNVTSLTTTTTRDVWEAQMFTIGVGPDFEINNYALRSDEGPVTLASSSISRCELSTGTARFGNATGNYWGGKIALVCAMAGVQTTAAVKAAILDRFPGLFT